MKERMEEPKTLHIISGDMLLFPHDFKLIKALQKSESYFSSVGKWDIQCTQGVSMNMYAKNIPK